MPFASKTTLFIVLLLLTTSMTFIFYFTTSQNIPTDSTNDAADLFPTSDDAPAKDTPTGVIVSQDDTYVDESGEPANSLFSQGGTAPILPHQVDQLREIILVSQEVPTRVVGERWYFVAHTPMHTTHIVVVPDGSAYVDVVLNQAPYTMSRMYAESEFAHLFNGERDDLCGFPFNIHVDSDPLLKERGNLGLEYCGANTLGENE